MPYPYTPTPVYTSPVQLASDGDPASSATIMGPIEAALDNVAAIYELGAKRLRTVASLLALTELAGMEDGEIALVAASDDGTPASHYGLWRYTPGADELPNPYRVPASGGAGMWIWIDYTRLGASGGLCALDAAGNLATSGFGPGEITVSSRIQVEQTGRIDVDPGETAVTLAGEIVLQRRTSEVTTKRSAIMRVQGGAYDSFLAPDEGGMLVEDGGAVKLLSGGVLRAYSGGEIDAQAGSTVTVSGTLDIATGGTLTLHERIHHEVVRYAAGALNGTPINVTASTADEHILAYNPGAATTIILADPPAVGLRVRFARDAIVPTTTVLTLTASGTSYSISGTNGHLRWLELTSALNGILPTWYPSAYAIH